jgi:hypothetical protein
MWSAGPPAIQQDHKGQGRMRDKEPHGMQIYLIAWPQHSLKTSAASHIFMAANQAGSVLVLATASVLGPEIIVPTLTLAAGLVLAALLYMTDLEPFTKC